MRLRSAALEATIKATKQNDGFTISISGNRDGVNPPEATEDAPSRFSGAFEPILLEGDRPFFNVRVPDGGLIRHFEGKLRLQLLAFQGAPMISRRKKMI